MNRESLSKNKIYSQQSTESQNENIKFKDLYDEALMKFATVSDKLRTVNSNKVAIPAFCDILWLYANINTYFTPNEVYKKTKGEDQKIRKCDVRGFQVEVIRNELGE